MAKPSADVEELPRSIVRRVVKDKLSESSEGQDIAVHKDALLAFSESARIFVHYLSATANDICKESKRQTINADDVFKALEEIEFPEFVGPLKISLDDFRQENAAKKSEAKSKGAGKKRKVEEKPAQNKQGVGEDAEEGDGHEIEDDVNNDE